MNAKEVMMIFTLSVIAINVVFAQETNIANENKLIPFQKGKKWGLKNTTGNITVPAKYTLISDFKEGIAAVNLGGNFTKWGLYLGGGKWGFINEQGEEVTPCTYNDAKSFSEGLAAVKMENKWGFINKSGTEIIPCKYDEAENFSEGLAVVRKEKKYGYIDAAGAEVIPFEYDYARSFSEGLAAVNVGAIVNMTSFSGGKWGFIDKSGAKVIPFEYDYAENFSEGLAAVSVGVMVEIIHRGLGNATFTSFKGGEWGFIDKSGNVVIPIKYATAESAKSLNSKWK